MIPSFFSKFNITRVGAGTPNPAQSSQRTTLGGRSADDDTSSLSQHLSQLDLNEVEDSSEEEDARAGTEARGSFEEIVYEDGDEFSSWSIPSSVLVTSTASSPAQVLPVPSAQLDGHLSALPVQQQQRQLEKERQGEEMEEQEERVGEEEEWKEQKEQDGREEERQEEQQEQQLEKQQEEELQKSPYLQYYEWQQQRYQMRLPIDVWIKICSHLYPSQLARFSLVSRDTYSLVASLDTWETWFKRMYAHVNIKLRLLPGLPRSHSYMLFMCSISFQVCEKCLKRCDGRRQRGRLAMMPLPVIVPYAGLKGSINDEPADLEDVKTMKPGGKEDHHQQEESWTIRMCKRCRVLHYQSHPEPIPHEIIASFQTKRVLREKYRLGPKEIQAITLRSRGSRRYGRPVTYSEFVALIKSRQVFGGDVGRHAVSRSLYKPMAVLNHRVFMYNKRIKILEDGHRWLPYQEYQARKAAGQPTCLSM
ncbi:hypothetical protein BGZ65_003490 [Modicella reniformis]|uniref:F-box domain-containing protein n=1 Tax=Modicella reniformis TaxID=1440133 RepID=A0A9P6J6A8_9FUNG|nr:hypothetical protein BGZ65_003490 [Modicella reniformis]